MPKTCSICTHPERTQIDKLLIEQVSLRNISAQFRVSVSALHRHKTEHLPAHLTLAKEAQQVANAESLLKEVVNLKDRALYLLSEAEASGDLRGALLAIREARATLELLGKMTEVARAKMEEEQEDPLFRLLNALAARVEAEHARKMRQMEEEEEEHW